MEQLVSEAIAEPRVYAALLTIFGIVAMLLAAIGIYGVMAYNVTQRTHEIGVRMALGAKPASVLGMVLGRGVKLALAGIAIGLIGAVTLTRLMEQLLFGISPTDPLTFGAIAVLFTMVALVSCYVPARRATKVDPLVALRD
jgi:putative ABC transport system permease protein